MAQINTGQFQDSFVIYFGKEGGRINAYTLASTLVQIADAARAANASINPGYDIEVHVEALGQGSFKTCVRATYRMARNIFSADGLRNIVLGVIASYIYQVTLAPDTTVTVKIETDEVIIEQGDTVIVIPRNTYEGLKEAEKNQQFKDSIHGALQTISQDQEIRSVGIMRSMDEAKPQVEVLAERLGTLPKPLSLEKAPTRDIEQIAEVEVLRAIFERSTRRWEFVWNGIRIPAPVLHDAFYEDLATHKVTLATGDVLRVRLKIKQYMNPDTGVYLNEAYEVVEVLQHTSRPRQTRLDI